MRQGFFTNLPSEMTINILSRLPARIATCCKCVCKPWLNLLESEEFAKSHVSKSIPGLALQDADWITLLEFEDDRALDFESGEHQPIPLLSRTSLVTSFRVYTYGSVLCSANGLLLLRGLEPNSFHNLCICNPITREYIELQCPNPIENISFCCRVGVVFGFGVSQKSGQLKVVKMNSLDRGRDQDPQSEAHVYVLGTGSWRRIATSPPFRNSTNRNGVLVNGIIHWLMYDVLTKFQQIHTFDLETEVFSSLVLPPLPQNTYLRRLDLGAVGDCLCVSADSAEETMILWLMKKYGDEKSWTKEFVIHKNYVDRYATVSPIKILKDGEILMANGGETLFYYTKNEESSWRIQKITKPRLFILHATIHTSTFLSLRTFQMERVNFF